MAELPENLKNCPFCSKKVQNLGAHIANLHPRILEKLDEFEENRPEKVAPEVVFAQTQGVKKSTADLIREKLDMMMDIKILEMLSSNKDLKDIQAAITPQPPPLSTLDKLREIREYSNIVNDIKGGGLEQNQNNEWVGLATAALPIVQDLMKSKKQPQTAGVSNNVRTGESTNTGILKPIQLEITGNPRKPTSNLEKPRAVSTTEQPNN